MGARAHLIDSIVDRWVIEIDGFECVNVLCALRFEV